MQFDPDQALDQAMAVFWRQGYDGTSLRDLLDATGLSKSSLYQTFGSKAELFERVLDRYCAQMVQAMRAQLRAAPNARGFFEGVFFEIATQADSDPGAQGCLLMNTITEFGREPVSFQPAVQRGMSQFASVFLDAIQQGRQEGDIKATQPPRELADFLLASMAGLRTLVKSGMNSRRARSSARMILQTLG